MKKENFINDNVNVQNRLLNEPVEAEAKYNNNSIRRQDRLLDESDAMELLRNGEFGILSMVESVGEKVGGYGIPINYVWDSENSIYFHCALEGYKLSCLKESPLASFCVVGHTNVIPHKFSTAYESIVIRGTVCIELSPEERMEALMLILDKYSPYYKDAGVKYTKKSFHRTNVIRLDIKDISGKTKRIES